MLGITEIKQVMSIEDIDLYKKFCVMNGIKGIGPADITVIEGNVIPGYPFNDHSMFMYAFDGTVYLVVNPYLSDEDCRDYLKRYNLDGEVFGKDASFYYPGNTNLVKINIGTYSTEQ